MDLDFSGIDEPETWIALLSLAAMEIVLGIDNIVFITILTGRLPVEQRTRTARIGIFLALFLRIALLFAITWIMSLTAVLTTVAGVEITGKSLILMLGGLFLVGKSVTELHKKIDGHDDAPVGTSGQAKRAAGMVVLQILALDLVFSLDSVITAVGMVEPDEIWVMVIAVIAAVIVMLAGAKPIGEFVTRHPTIKVLALAFLILIGVMLIAEGLGRHIPKGYIYFSIAFALAVEFVNMRIRRAPRPPAAAPPAAPPPVRAAP